MIDIVPANIRDYTYIASNMRDEDRREIFCQLPEEATSRDVAIFSLNYASHAYTVRLRGRNVAAVGATQLSVCGSVYSAWAWGTKELNRVAPRIGRYFLSVIAPKLIVDGCRRVEVRSIEGHDMAHRWLTTLGARCESRMQDYGRNGELFLLYSFTLTDLKRCGYSSMAEPQPSKLKTTGSIPASRSNRIFHHPV